MSEGNGTCSECGRVFPQWKLMVCSCCGKPVCPNCLEDIGNMMENQLTRYKDKDQCRWCGKRDKVLEDKNVAERFCCEECFKIWYDLLELRISQGKHVLRVRAFN